MYCQTEEGDTKPSENLAVVEFDDHGDFWDIDQLKAARQMVSQAGKKPLLVVYVHGWNNDARSDNSGLRKLNNLVETLNSERAMGGFKAYGLYLGWRGKSAEPAPLRPFTFWSRKKGSDRMADVPLTRTLTQMYAATRANSGRAVVIGHSFGGRILEKSLGESLAAQMSRQQDRGTRAEISSLADLIVLINPASESLIARKTKMAFQGWQKDYPLMVAVGAEDDGATGRLWPVGYWIWPFRPPGRTYEGENVRQSTFLDKTVTNDPRQLTHRLEVVEDSGNPGSAPSWDQAFGRNLRPRASDSNEPIWIRSNEDNGQVTPWVLRELDANAQSVLREDGMRTRNLDYTLPSKAYWVFRVKPVILSGHSGSPDEGVLNVAMTDLVAGIISKARIFDPNRSAPSAPATEKEVEIMRLAR